MSETEPAGIGHNNPPPYDAAALAALRTEVVGCQTANAEWKAKPIEAKADAEKANDFLTGVRGLFKRVEERRKADKEPHAEAAKAVDAAFKPLLDALEQIGADIKAKLTAFAVAEEARIKAEAAAARAAAEEAARLAAEEAAKAAARGDMLAEMEAQQAADAAAKAAEKTAREPARAQIASATGAGRTASLRVSRKAAVANILLLFNHYRNHPDVTETLLRLANADIRAAKGADVKIPGINIIEEKAVA